MASFDAFLVAFTLPPPNPFCFLGLPLPNTAHGVGFFSRLYKSLLGNEIIVQFKEAKSYMIIMW